MPGMCMSMGLHMRLQLRLEMKLELRLEQKLQLAQRLVLNMEQLTKEERDELARQGLLGSGIADPLRIRHRNVDGKEVVMKKFGSFHRDAYKEAGNMEKMTSLGFGAPEVVGVVESKQNTYLVTKFKWGAVNLRSILHNPRILGLSESSAPESIANLVYNLGKEIAALHKAGVDIHELKLENILANGGEHNDYSNIDGFIHTGLKDVEFTGAPIKRKDRVFSLRNFFTDTNLGKFEKYEEDFGRFFMAGYRGTEMPSIESFADKVKKDLVFLRETDEEQEEVELYKYLSRQRNRIQNVEKNIRKAILEVKEFNAQNVFEAATKEFKASLDPSRVNRCSADEEQMFKALIYAVEGLKEKFDISYTDTAYRALLPDGFEADDDDEYLKQRLREAHNEAQKFGERTYTYAFKMGVPNIDSFRQVYVDAVIERACMEFPNWTLKSLKAYMEERGLSASIDVIKDAIDRLRGKNCFVDLDVHTRKFLVKYFDEVSRDESKSLDYDHILALLKGEQRKKTGEKFLRKLVLRYIERQMLEYANLNKEPDYEEVGQRFSIEPEKLREMYIEYGGIFKEVRDDVERVMEEEPEETATAEEAELVEAEAVEAEAADEEEIEEAETEEAEAVQAAAIEPAAAEAPEEEEAYELSPPSPPSSQPIESDHAVEPEYLLKEQICQLIEENVRIPNEDIAYTLDISEAEVEERIREIIEERGLEHRRREVVQIVQGQFDIQGDELSRRSGLSIRDLNLILRSELDGGRIFVGALSVEGSDDNQKKEVLRNLLTKSADISDRELSDNLQAALDEVRSWVEQLKVEMGINDEIYDRVRRAIISNPGIEDDGICEITGLSPIQIHLALRNDLTNGMLGIGQPRD